MSSKSIPYPATTLQCAHQAAGSLIIQGVPERYRQSLILVIFQVLTQIEAEARLDPTRITPQELIQLLPAEVILAAAEELIAKAY